MTGFYAILLCEKKKAVIKPDFDLIFLTKQPE